MEYQQRGGREMANRTQAQAIEIIDRIQRVNAENPNSTKIRIEIQPEVCPECGMSAESNCGCN
jgi:hypothetical protein